MFKTFLLNIFVFFIMLGAVSCFAPPAYAEEVQVTGWTLFVDDGKGAPGEEVDSFLPSDQKLHFRADIEGEIKAGAKVKWTFTSVDTPAGKDMKITDVEFAVEKAGATGINGSVSLPRDWPVGKYRADLYLDGNLIDALEYEVVEEEK